MGSLPDFVETCPLLANFSLLLADAISRLNPFLALDVIGGSFAFIICSTVIYPLVIPPIAVTFIPATPRTASKPLCEVNPYLGTVV